MKVKILNINEAVLCGAEHNECSEYISSQIFSRGGIIDEECTIKFNENKINKFLEGNDSVDFVFCIVEDTPTVFQNSKELLTKFCKDDLVENSFAQNAVDNYYNAFSLKKDRFYNKLSLLPRNAKCIVNPVSQFQGFYMENNNITYFFLPANFSSIKCMMEDFIGQYISSRFRNLHKNTTYKLFGLTKEQVLVLLEDLLNNKNKIKVNIYQNGLEQTLKIEYSNYTPIEDVNLFIADFVKRLNPYIYAVEDLSIYEIVYYLLKVNNTTLAVAESITGGSIVSNLIKYNSGISNYLKEGLVTYTKSSKINRLNISQQFLDKYTDVSAETAYEMCVGLLQSSKADICISTCGYSELDNKKAGFAFIAVGDNSGVHVYKVCLSGTREQVIENVSKAALFHLIKKLKK